MLSWSVKARSNSTLQGEQEAHSQLGEAVNLDQLDATVTEGAN